MNSQCCQYFQMFEKRIIRSFETIVEFCCPFRLPIRSPTSYRYRESSDDLAILSLYKIRFEEGLAGHLGEIQTWCQSLSPRAFRTK